MCLTKQYLIKNQCKCSCPIRKLKNNFTLSQNKTFTTRNRLSLIVACWLPTVCGVPTCSTCMPSLCDAGEVWRFHQKPGNVRQEAHHVWILSSSMIAFGASSSRTCGRPLWGSAQSDRSHDLNFSMPGSVLFTHSIIPKCFTHSASWCSCNKHTFF